MRVPEALSFAHFLDANTPGVGQMRGAGMQGAGKCFGKMRGRICGEKSAGRRVKCGVREEKEI